jgi:hypothetical protein
MTEYVERRKTTHKADYGALGRVLEMRISREKTGSGFTVPG